jgi:hypothetical protein
MSSSNHNQPSVAIIGARTNNQGTGPWIANFLSRHGAVITSILGTKKETVFDAVNDLQQRFGIICQGHTEWHALMASGRPDLLVIASPPDTHREYLALALQTKIPVFCEKPFLWDKKRDNLSDAGMLIDGFLDNEVPLFINTQCPENLEEFQKIHPECDMKNIRSFDMELCPSSSGRSMLIDAMPHAWSMLTALAGRGRLESIQVTFSNEQQCDVHGVYLHAQGSCIFHVTLRNRTEQPRPFGYTINGYRVDRVIDTKDYSMSFKTDSGVYSIADPLEKRIKKVLTSLKNKTCLPTIQKETLALIFLEMDLLVKTIEAA